MITYEVRCATCGRVYPVYISDPSKAPMCCGHKMDAMAVEVEDQYETV